MNRTNRDRPVCGSCGAALGGGPLFRVEAGGSAYEILPCPRCGCGTTFPVPSPEDLSRFYGFRSYRTDSGARFHPLVEGMVDWARGARGRRLERLAGRPGRLLDVGCGRALFLRRMRRAGWDVAGVEADPEVSRAISETHGLDIRGGSPEGWGFPEESFDAVTLHHALEHVPRPMDMIAHCRRLLRDGGLLVAAVPNRDSLQAEFGGASWFHLDPPFHLHHFTASGLASLLEKCGFRVVGRRHLDLEQNFFGWVQTLLNLCGIPRNLLFDFLKRSSLRDDAVVAGKGWKIAASFLLLLPIFPLGAVLTLFEATGGRGGTVEIAAVKEGA